MRKSKLTAEFYEIESDKFFSFAESVCFNVRGNNVLVCDFNNNEIEIENKITKAKKHIKGRVKKRNHIITKSFYSKNNKFIRELKSLCNILDVKGIKIDYVFIDGIDKIFNNDKQKIYDILTELNDTALLLNVSIYLQFLHNWQLAVMIKNIVNDITHIQKVKGGFEIEHKYHNGWKKQTISQVEKIKNKYVFHKQNSVEQVVNNFKNGINYVLFKNKKTVKMFMTTISNKLNSTRETTLRIILDGFNFDNQETFFDFLTKEIKDKKYTYVIIDCVDDLKFANNSFDEVERMSIMFKKISEDLQCVFILGSPIRKGVIGEEVTLADVTKSMAKVTYADFVIFVELSESLFKSNKNVVVKVLKTKFDDEIKKITKIKCL